MKFNLKKFAKMFERGDPRVVLYEYLLRGKAELREIKKAWEGIEDNQPDLNIIKEILGE